MFNKSASSSLLKYPFSVVFGVDPSAEYAHLLTEIGLPPIASSLSVNESLKKFGVPLSIDPSISPSPPLLGVFPSLSKFTPRPIARPPFARYLALPLPVIAVVDGSGLDSTLVRIVLRLGCLSSIAVYTSFSASTDTSSALLELYESGLKNTRRQSLNIDINQIKSNQIKSESIRENKTNFARTITLYHEISGYVPIQAYSSSHPSPLSPRTPTTRATLRRLRS
jgi:hypothetical protein